MIRRLAGRVRRRVAALLMPLAHRLRNRLINLSRSGAVFGVIATELSRSLRRRPSRSGVRPLRVGVDISPFYEPLTGVGWYLFYLLEELAGMPEVELVLFGEPLLTDDGPRLYVSLPPGSRVVGVDLRNKVVHRLSRPLSLAAYLGMTMLERCDLIFGANYFLPRRLSRTARKRVVTVHDLTYRRFPELLQNETLANLDREMLRELTRADAVICVSRSTRDDILREYQIDPRKVVAIHSGIHVPSTTSSKTSRKSYILFVSTIEPRKNLETLVKAFEILREEGRYSGELVVAGKVGWKAEPILATMKSSRWSSSIRHVDYVDRDRLSELYAGADVFVLPSIYEGFGFPILEAMTHGVPVVAARSSSLPEVGGDAAVYFDPTNASELATAIVSAREQREELVQKGAERVRQFPWHRTAVETLAVFQRVTESG